MDLSVIIVSYNVKDLLKKCLESVFRSQTRYSFEVFVHDNGSTDSTVEMVKSEFPDVQVKPGKNIGFSAGNNAAIKQANGKYILLLNPDTEVMPDTFEMMLNFMEQNQEAGMATCRLELPNGELDKACRRSFPTPWVSFTRLSGLAKLFPKSKTFNRYNLGFLPENKTHEIDSCVGAFQLVRRKVIDQIGLLDEDFFLYGEDIDWCYRAKQGGWKIYYHPATRTIHHKRQSSGLESYSFSKRALWEFHRAMIIFHKKHFSRQYSAVFNWIVYTSIHSLYFVKLLLSYSKLLLAKLKVQNVK